MLQDSKGRSLVGKSSTLTTTGTPPTTNTLSPSVLQPKGWRTNQCKTPNPSRTLEIFSSLQNGLTGFINLTQGDIDLHRLLRNSIENGLYLNSAQQCKNGERYLKRLEFELAKLEELKDQYDVHLKMREGVRTMAYAYTMSSGPERDSALSSVRSGYKECTETLCFLESRLESMMGTFHLQMKGIQGFARLCPGDVFEITIKHSESQKWKTRGKILKSGEQSWDHQSTIIKALIEDKLTIKAVEVRGLGKNITLGVKTCETKDLFSARPQLMTINLNSVGTLKLNLIITWNPLHTSTTDSIGPNGSTLSRTSSNSLLGSRSSLTLPSLFSPSFYSKSTLNATLPPPRITEIIDADYYIHRTLSSSNPPSSSSTTSSTSSSGSGGGIPGIHHSINEAGDISISEIDHHHCGGPSHSQGTTPTSTSSGSRGSSLHLTVTSGFGSASGSASSYCGSTSVPNSTLTSPETEIPPSSMQTSTNGHENYINNKDDNYNHQQHLNNNNNNNNNNYTNNNNHNTNGLTNDSLHCSKQQQQQSMMKCSKSINNLCLKQTTERLLKEMGKSPQEIIVEATVHQSCSSLATSATTPTTTTTNSSSNTSLYSNNNINNSVNNISSHHRNNNSYHDDDCRVGRKLTSYSSTSLSSPSLRHQPNHQSLHQRHLVSSHSLANVYFNISDILLNLMSSLEDIQGQYSEIHYLHQSVLELYRILRNICRLRGSIFCNNNNNFNQESSLPVEDDNCCLMSSTDWKHEQSNNMINNRSNNNNNPNSKSERYKRLASSTSDVSLSVEDALECFDFLNNAVIDSDAESSPAASASATPKTRKYDSRNGIAANKWKQKGSSSSSHHHHLNQVNSSSSPSLVRSKATSMAAGLNVVGNVHQSSSPLTTASPISTPRSSGHQKGRRLGHHHSTSMTALSPSSGTTDSTPSSIDSPQPLSTGSEQLDICLMAHLNYCQRLLQNLGSFGPLRMREKRSLDKLSCQGTVIHRLASLCSNLCDYFVASSRYLVQLSFTPEDDLQQNQQIQQQLKWLEAQYQNKQETELSILREDSRIRKLWDTVCYQNASVDSEEIGSMLLCVTSGQFAQTLESYMRAFLTPSTGGSSTNGGSRHGKRSSPGGGNNNGLGGVGVSPSLSTSSLSLSSSSSSNLSMYRKVAQLITNRIIDSPMFENDYVVTIFQVALYFRTENCSLEYLFKSYAEEIALLESLSTDNPVALKQSLNRFRKTLPPQEPLFNIALLLLDRDPLVVGIAETYFNEVASNKQLRVELLNHFLEGLEVDSRYVRHASCKVMKILKASEFMKHLAYISLADDCSEVRDQAKAALFSFGTLGRKLYTESQLFAHGFM
ncbi:rho family-interacting cell polarization regulator 1-like isoform X2 [Panonychus citri]|uniref:rho family-interacting cell polarization regulator 1-like isoform X2 n=1 Tax=Panonychus citri TaxID=50023 RepID=UPI002307F665|nr:rho family-interacting cell polarization regulator 1-like isoform X2 [Panonychus citri]